MRRRRLTRAPTHALTARPVPHDALGHISLFYHMHIITPYSQASLRRIFAVYASANKDLDDQLQSSKFMSVGMPHIVHTHTPLCPKGRCAMHSPLTLHSVHPLSP